MIKNIKYFLITFCLFLSLFINLLVLNQYLMASLDDFLLSYQPILSSSDVITHYSCCYNNEKNQQNSKGNDVDEIPNPKPCLASGGPYSPCREGKCCTSDCPPCKASPVVTGGAYERFDTDFSLQGKGFPFQFSRYYLSANKNISSVGFSWFSPLDLSLITITNTYTAYFQSIKETIQLNGNSPLLCDSNSYYKDEKNNFLLKAITINQTDDPDSKCYFVLTDYQNEKKYIFFKDQKFNNLFPLNGLIKAICDYYSNCWIFQYSDISSNQGMLAPTYIYNATNWINNGIYINLHYLTEPSFFGLLDYITDCYGRKFIYYYDELIALYEENQGYMIGAQGSYIRLRRVESSFNQSPPLPLWQYDYYEPSSYYAGFYTLANVARPTFLISVKDKYLREIEKITYYIPNYTSSCSNAKYDRVKSITNEEGTINYSDYRGKGYSSVCGDSATNAYCEYIYKSLNNYNYKIQIDTNTGFITNIINPYNYSEQYCYYQFNKIAYHKDENDNYTRYEYDPDSKTLTKIVRDACPFNPSNCSKLQCNDKSELTWLYSYYFDDDNMPIKIRSIIAPPGFQSYYYEYYNPSNNSNCPLCPSWSLKAIYRIEADTNNNYSPKTTNCFPNNQLSPYCHKIAEYTYYTDGLIHTSSDSLGNTTSYSYYPNGEIQSISYPPNNNNYISPTYSYSYAYNQNAYFKIETITDPNNVPTQYYYDQYERISKITLPDPGNGTSNFSTLFFYDIIPQSYPELRCTDQIDPNNITTRSCYDKFNNLIFVIQDFGSNPDNKNISTYFSYQNGLLTSITDANNYTTYYYYDKLRRLQGIDYPDVDANLSCPEPNSSKKCDVIYSYYPNGLLAYKKDAKNQIIAYIYDPLSRLIAKDFNNDSSNDIVYSYSLPSQLPSQMLLSVSDYTKSPTRTFSFSYDEFFRLSSISTIAPNFNLIYNYYDNDLLNYYLIQGDNKQVIYQYYPDGSTKSIQKDNISISYDYYLSGQKKNIYYLSSPNPAIKFFYDNQGRLTKIENYSPDGSSPLSSYEYTYDFNHSSPAQPIYKGYRTAMIESIYSQQIQRYEKYYYDRLYQLIATDYTDLQTRYEWQYDNIGNRLSQRITDYSTRPPIITQDNYSYYTFSPNSNNSQLLKHDGNYCYLWDNNGNLACKWQTDLSSCNYSPHAACPNIFANEGDSVYLWDIEDKLIEMHWYEQSALHQSEYKYDYNGDRYQKTVDSISTNYFYHNEDIIKEEILSEAYEYLHGPGIDEPAVQLCLGSNCISPSAYYYADGLGSILNQYRYGSYGELAHPFSKSEQSHNPYAYTAREFEENNLFYYRARYYKQNIAIFISADEFKEYWSSYNYCKNSPVLYNDPSGLFRLRIFDCDPFLKDRGRIIAAFEEANRNAALITSCAEYKKEIDIECFFENKCGKSDKRLNKIYINLKFFNNGGGCGGPNCLKSTVLHELVHQCHRKLIKAKKITKEKTECFAYACEARFYPECKREYLDCTDKEKCLKICN